MTEPLKIELEIDIDSIKQAIEDAVDLNDNEAIFKELVSFEKAKKQLKDAMEQITSVEDTAKGLINSKANALYTSSWEAIQGHGYKITKSPTGSVFSMEKGAKVPKQFLVIKESVDTKLVNKYIKEEGKLPKGLVYNPTRGQSIRITVNE